MADANGCEVDMTSEKKKIFDIFGTSGYASVIAYVTRKIEHWKTIPLQCGIIGSSGVGKSSFTNAICSIPQGSRGSAKVGVTETTSEPTKYTYRGNTQLVFWDLPGFNTSNFPLNSYLEQIKINRYDFFVIISATRFTSNEVWIAEELHKRNLDFYFVRSKIDMDVANDKTVNGVNHCKNALLKLIRTVTVEQLNTHGINKPVFLIDSNHSLDYDLEKLRDTIINNLPDHKRHAIMLTLLALTPEMIRMKGEELRKRMKWVAFKSAAVNFLPIPGLNVRFDANQITSEVTFYFEQFGLDDDSLERRAVLMKVNVDTLKEIVKREIPQETGRDLLKMLATRGDYTTTKAISSVARLIPFIGGLITSPSSVSFTYFSLNYMLETLEKASLEVAKCRHPCEDLPASACEHVTRSDRQRELINALSRMGLPFNATYLQSKIRNGIAVPLKVGVIGSTGVGKSSFINAIRGLKPGVAGAALVDVMGCTVISAEYRHPDNIMLTFWDFPGVGASPFPMEHCLEQIQENSFDCFVIIVATRFTDTDVLIAKHIADQNIRYYFVRSKVGLDVENDKYANDRNHNEKAVLDKIRREITKTLNTHRVNTEVFLIDSHHPSKYDFVALKQTILNDLSLLNPVCDS